MYGEMGVLIFFSPYKLEAFLMSDKGIRNTCFDQLIKTKALIRSFVRYLTFFLYIDDILITLSI